MLFNKVTSCGQLLEDGTVVPLEKDRLYRVVANLYCAQMLGVVNARSFGLLTITPKDADGNEITDFEAHAVTDQTGRQLKEWVALASYLEYLGQVPEEYSAPQGRKVVLSSWNPIELVKSPNWITLLALLVLVVLIVVLVLVLRAILGRRGRRRYGRGRYGSGPQTYRGRKRRRRR
jgi:hypothetical protein